jgi:predicted Rossmann fold nucleotide-binding protein DprA/Smf involved in DNA uptake
VLRLLPRDDDVPLETLLEQAAHPPDEVLTALFSLELAGLVDVLPGGAYRRARNTARQGPV